MNRHIAILKTGLVTSIGFSAPAACAAIRAGIANPCPSDVLDSFGRWIMVHEVPLERTSRGTARLTTMALMAIHECMAELPQVHWARVPLVLCIAESERPGRLQGIERELPAAIQSLSGIGAAPGSCVIPRGRVSACIALLHARQLLQEDHALVLIVATDSMLNQATLTAFDRDERLLTESNSNGFLPGEGAAALLVGSTWTDGQLACTGLGFATEDATINSGEPFRGEAMTLSFRAALKEAGMLMHHMDLRIADLSGEQYYFKEAALALAKTLRVRKEELDIWHPAECIGEAGAVSGLTVIIVADAAARKGYAPGPNILCHFSNDTGERAAAIMRFKSSTRRPREQSSIR